MHSCRDVGNMLDALKTFSSHFAVREICRKQVFALMVSSHVLFFEVRNLSNISDIMKTHFVRILFVKNTRQYL